MSIKIRETGILCPECEIPLVHIPKGVVETDLAVCPDCGLGGDYTEVVEKGGNLSKSSLSLDRIRELVKQYGFTRK
jgi:Zn-finger nucleic acid-binding protein